MIDDKETIRQDLVDAVRDTGATGERAIHLLAARAGYHFELADPGIPGELDTVDDAVNEAIEILGLDWLAVSKLIGIEAIH